MAVSTSATRRVFEYALLLGAMLLMSDALIPLLYGNPQLLDRGADTDSNPAKLLFTTAVLGVGLLFILYRPRASLDLMKASWLVLAVTLLPVISALWSLDPSVTLKRAVAHLLTVAFAFYIVTRWRPETFLRLTLLAFTLGCAASDVAAVAIPSLGLNHDPLSGNLSAWVGVYGDKIMSGGISAAAILLALAMPARDRWQMALQWATLPICGLLLAMSQSRTGWVMAILGLLVLGLARLLALPNIAKSLKVGAVSVLGGLTAVGLVAAAAGPAALAGPKHDILGPAPRFGTWRHRGCPDPQPVAGFGVPRVLDRYRRNPRPQLYRLLGAPGRQRPQRLPRHLAGNGLARRGRVHRLRAGPRGRPCRARMLAEPKAWRWRALLILLIAFLMNNASYTLAYKHSCAFWACCFVAALYVTQSRLAQRAAQARRQPYKGPQLAQRGLAAARVMTVDGAGAAE